MFIFANPLVTDKENVSVNKNRAILAISMVQKPPAATSSRPTILKKSVSVSQIQVKKPQHAPSKVALKVENKTAMNQRKTCVNDNPGHRQFDYAEIHKKNKEALIKKLKEQEDKELKFNFHANPVPKFKKQTLTAMTSKQTSVDEKKLAKRSHLIKQNSLPAIQIPRKFSKENIVPSCGDPERLKFMVEKKKRLLQKYQEVSVQFKVHISH